MCLHTNMRLFTVITLPENVKTLLHYTSMDIQERIDNGRFTHSDNYHITLVFLGDVNEQDLPTIKKCIDDSATQSIPLYLNCTVISHFQKGNRKILYYNVKGNTQALIGIQRRLYQRFYDLGLCRTQDGYTPHITFARHVKTETIPTISQNIDFASAEITLMHATRIDERLMYLPIYSAALQGTFIIDRIEHDIAVCRHDNGTFFNINISFLPKGVSSGDKIRYNGLDYNLDDNHSSQKSAALRARMNRRKKCNWES